MSDNMKTPRAKNTLKYAIINLYKIVMIGIAAILILHYLYENSSLYYRRLYRSPLAMHLNSNKLVLKKGEEYKLKVVFRFNKRVSYSSTNFRVAGVNFNGRVKAHQIGNTFILAKVGDRILKCKVSVIDLNQEKLILKKGEAYRLKVKGDSSFPHYKSSNKKVASVNWLGKIKAKGEGKAVITIKVKGKTLYCEVTVR